jgi:hypothetical protein
VDAVFARSQGNPFFTEELLAMVRAGSDGLPATLRDLLRGRVAALPDPASKVLEVVAMAGRRTASIGNQIDQQLWTQLPSIPLYQVPSFLAWRQDLLNVVNNPTTESVFWNAGSWGYAKP